MELHYYKCKVDDFVDFDKDFIYAGLPTSERGIIMYGKNNHQYTYKEIGPALTRFTEVTKAEYEAQEQKSKFVVDKWYKWFQTDHSCFHYGKFERFGLDTFRMSPWIIQQNTFCEDGCFRTCNATQIEEISVEVVQQYLPEGHEDRIEQWIPSKGEWVIITDGPHKSSTAFKIYRGSAFISGEYIVEILNKLYPTVPLRCLRKAFTHEIPTEEQWIPEVGDWVVITEYESGDRVGSIVQVSDVGSNRISYKPTKDSYPFLVAGFKSIRKATPEEIASVTGSKDEVLCGSISQAFSAQAYGYTPDTVLNGVLLKEPTEEDLIAEAKRRYPIGTKYISASPLGGKTIYTIESLSWANAMSSNMVFGEEYKGCLYYKGKWAEIVSLPGEIPANYSKEIEKMLSSLSHTIDSDEKPVLICSKSEDPSQDDIIESKYDKGGAINKEVTIGDKPILISKVKTSNKIIVL